MSVEDVAFESVLEVVGNDGRFQRRFNVIFMFVLVVLAVMPYGNIIMALAVPDHWCFVPGRENTTYSIEEWKDLHIPKDNKTRDYRSCQMYDENLDAIGCRFGWEFDSTWYGATVVTQESWVCDGILHVTNAFAIARLGELLGIFCFGQLADAIGRKPVFLMTIATTVVGRMMSVATAHSAPLFFASVFIGNLASTSLCQGPLIISMEISKTQNRAKVAMLQCICWSIGFCLLAIIMWIVRDWQYVVALTTIPCSLYLFSGKWLIESPRWLAGKRKSELCVRELRKVAKLNGTSVPEQAVRELTAAPGKKEKAYGFLAVFSSWRLTKNSLLLILSWSATIFIYDSLTINVNNLSVNPFASYLLQSSFEAVGFCVGKFSSDRFGRRWTHVASFLGTFLGCLPVFFLVDDRAHDATVAAICVYLKFSISLAYFVVNLESLEIYPTCIRQTGMGMGIIAANLFALAIPYVVFLGSEINPSFLYIVSATTCLIGGLCGIFLPETLNHQLPETLAEAAVFGAQQDYLGNERLRRVRTTEIEIPLNEKLP